MITFRRMQVSTSVKISLIMIKTCQIYAQRLGALTRNWMANYWLCLTIRSRVGGTENWLNMCDGTKTFTLTPKHCKLFLYFFGEGLLGVFPWSETRKWNSPLEQGTHHVATMWKALTRQENFQKSQQWNMCSNKVGTRADFPRFSTGAFAVVMRPEITMNLIIR